MLHVPASSTGPMPAFPQKPTARRLEEALGANRGLEAGAHGGTVHALAGQVPDVISQAAEEAGAELVVLSPHQFGAFFSPRVSDAVSHASRTAVVLAPEPGPDSVFGNVGELGRT
ncbi:universal stress protein [Streptomyces sp. NPDC002133]|uniref:universal stress protein n=1 Tax=Streptomyces sp. NPDC002133 TaxID=3154409 RepID=UPI0033270E5B